MNCCSHPKWSDPQLRHSCRARVRVDAKRLSGKHQHRLLSDIQVQSDQAGFVFGVVRQAGRRPSKDVHALIPRTSDSRYSTAGDTPVFRESRTNTPIIDVFVRVSTARGHND